MLTHTPPPLTSFTQISVVGALPPLRVSHRRRDPTPRAPPPRHPPPATRRGTRLFALFPTPFGLRSSQKCNVTTTNTLQVELRANDLPIPHPSRKSHNVNASGLPLRHLSPSGGRGGSVYFSTGSGTLTSVVERLPEHLRDSCQARGVWAMETGPEFLPRLWSPRA